MILRVEGGKIGSNTDGIGNEIVLAILVQM
jgi:hypothetical protein